MQGCWRTSRKRWLPSRSGLVVATIATFAGSRPVVEGKVLKADRFALEALSAPLQLGRDVYNLCKPCNNVGNR